MEIWRPVKGYETAYEVSDEGRVRSVDRTVVRSDGRAQRWKGKTLRFSRATEGYLGVVLPGTKRALVHRMVAEAFIPEIAGRSVVNHKNGDKRDNRADNLEWSTYAENNAHARKTGLQNQHSENCNLTRYSEQLVAAMRRVHERFGCTYTELAMLFDVSPMQAADIIKIRTRRKG